MLLLKPEYEQAINDSECFLADQGKGREKGYDAKARESAFAAADSIRTANRNQSDEENLTNSLTELMKWAKAHEIDFENCLSMATDHFVWENH